MFLIFFHQVSAIVEAELMRNALNNNDASGGATEYGLWVMAHDTLYIYIYIFSDSHI